MKRLIIIIIAAVTLFACSNQEKEFPDFEYTAVYFPLQFPVRTLVLGHDRIDNTLDNNLQFNIGVSIGGMYENNKDWTVDFDWNAELADTIKTLEGDTMLALPQKYIKSMTPSFPGTVTIPSGSFNGKIFVELEESFLDDPMAFGNHYVIPLEITGSNADSILTGIPTAADADKRKDSEWDANAKPRDFTLFCVKFVNMYHADYFQTGRVVGYDADNKEESRNTYSANHITDNAIVELATKGRNVVEMGALANTEGSILLTINGSDVTVSTPEGSDIEVNGSGKFYDIDTEQAVEWGDPTTKYQTFHLEYEYTDGGTRYEVNDTLVMRNRGIEFESFVLERNE